MKASKRNPIVFLAVAAIACVIAAPIEYAAEEGEDRTVSVRTEIVHAEEPEVLEPKLSLATPDVAGPGVGPNLRIIATAGCQDSEIGIGASRNGQVIAVAAIISIFQVEKIVRLLQRNFVVHTGGHLLIVVAPQLINVPNGQSGARQGYVAALLRVNG